MKNIGKSSREWIFMQEIVYFMRRFRSHLTSDINIHWLHLSHARACYPAWHGNFIWPPSGQIKSVQTCACKIIHDISPLKLLHCLHSKREEIHCGVRLLLVFKALPSETDYYPPWPKHLAGKWGIIMNKLQITKDKSR